jgi:hypothetical protein
MQFHHGGFMLELLTCRYCLGFWLALAAAVLSDIEYLPAIYFTSQLTYGAFKATDKFFTGLGDNNDE